MIKSLFIAIFCGIGIVLPAQILEHEIAFPNLTFDTPIDIQNAGDDSNRLFVGEMAGRIKVFDNQVETTSASTFLDITSKVFLTTRFGFLGFCFHPNYKENGYLYVHYIAPNPSRSVIARFKVNENNPNIVDPNSELILLEVGQPHHFHNGGQVAFGTDGYLYIVIGDGGPGADPSGHGQNRQTYLGSMLRIDVDNPDTNRNYGIPADNPFVGNTEGWLEEIWAWGLRNPWRFSIDPETDWLLAGENGESTLEEILHIEKGKNYGWSIMEGTHCFSPAVNCNTTGLELPIWEYGLTP